MTSFSIIKLKDLFPYELASVEQNCSKTQPKEDMPDQKLILNIPET